MVPAAIALAVHLTAVPQAAVRVAQAAPPASPETVQSAPSSSAPLWSERPAPAPPRWDVGAAFALPLGKPVTPGLVVRVRLRLVAGLWAHVGAGARAGAAPVDGGVREIPLELGVGYRLDLGQRFSLGVRGDAVVMSRRMTVSGAEPRHRWLGVLRGGAEARVGLSEEFGLVLFAGVEGRLGRTEVDIAGQRGVFSPVAPYFELGPSVSF